jgi:hypothetical protein
MLFSTRDASGLEVSAIVHPTRTTSRGEEVVRAKRPNVDTSHDERPQRLRLFRRREHRTSWALHPVK